MHVWVNFLKMNVVISANFTLVTGQILRPLSRSENCKSDFNNGQSKLSRWESFVLREKFPEAFSWNDFSRTRFQRILFGKETSDDENVFLSKVPIRRGS